MVGEARIFCTPARALGTCEGGVVFIVPIHAVGKRMVQDRNDLLPDAGGAPGKDAAVASSVKRQSVASAKKLSNGKASQTAAAKATGKSVAQPTAQRNGKKPSSSTAATTSVNGSTVSGGQQAKLKKALAAKATTTKNSSDTSGEEQDSRFRLHRGMIQGLESWSGSLVVHAVILLLLAYIFLPVHKKAPPPTINSVVLRPEETLTQLLDENTEAGSMIQMAGASSSTLDGAASQIEAVAEPKLDTAPTEGVQAPRIGLEAGLANLPDNGLGSDLGMESPGEPAAAVEGYGGAMDRITQEILLMLDNSKVLVVWLFDQSLSLKDDQEEIKGRLDRVYQELGFRTATDGDALLTVVASYGANSMVHTRRPTTEIESIQNAIDEIPIDESGEEATCKALVEIIGSHRKYAIQGKRQLALILVTDESGDDGDGIEPTIETARAANCRIYSLGREAVFGYPFATLRWVDPETQLEFWRQVRRGPETPRVEQMQSNGIWRRYDAHPSGFGPYELVRLCRETGGIYFMLPSLETNLVRGEKRIYELDAMRPYLPDSRSRAEYDSDLKKNPMRRTIGEVIATLNPISNPGFALQQDYPVDPNEFVAAANREAAKARVMIDAYLSAEQTLRQFEQQRRFEASHRWQANYDLLLAQTIAYRVRVNEYVAYIDAFMQNPKARKNPKTTHWRVDFRPKSIAAELPTTGEQTSDLVQASSELLIKVIKDHPGTPYAARAQWELGRGYGIEMREHFEDPRRATIDVPNF